MISTETIIKDVAEDSFNWRSFWIPWASGCELFSVTGIGWKLHFCRVFAGEGALWVWKVLHGSVIQYWSEEGNCGTDHWSELPDSRGVLAWTKGSRPRWGSPQKKLAQTTGSSLTLWQPENLHKTALPAPYPKAGDSEWLGQFVGLPAMGPGALPNE